MVTTSLGRCVWCAGPGVDGVGWYVSSVVEGIEIVVGLMRIDWRGWFTDGMIRVDIWMVGIVGECRGIGEEERMVSARQGR